MRGGRTLLTKVLKGSRQKNILELQLDRSPAHGHYKGMSESDVLARVDWVIKNGYLRIEYDYRLPLLVYTPAGWEIERETMARELLHGFDDLLLAGPPFHMAYLKDRDRGMILRLLDLVAETEDPRYIPLLQAWARVDYRKVRQRIGKVVRLLSPPSPGAPQTRS